MSARQKLTPNQLRKAWGVARETVVRWIRSGELPAINVAAPGRQPRYLIDVEDIRAFELRRRVAHAPEATPRKPRQTLKIPDYF